MNQTRPEQLVFFLGGHDLEMLTIRGLLEQHAPGRFHDRGLGWGARASSYRGEILAALVAGATPVLIELEDDLGLPDGTLFIADHHGARAGKEAPTALHQVFRLLALPPEGWTRWFDLVAANDRGYIPALRQIGASAREIADIRTADRRAQGITQADEDAAEQAVRHLELDAGGALTVVALAHARTATVTDRLHPALGGPGYRNLLVLAPGEANFFGEGRIVAALATKFPTAWYGGALPDQGFWGHQCDTAEQGNIRRIVAGLAATDWERSAGRLRPLAAL